MFEENKTGLLAEFTTFTGSDIKRRALEAMPPVQGVKNLAVELTPCINGVEDEVIRYCAMLNQCKSPEEEKDEVLRTLETAGWAAKQWLGMNIQKPGDHYVEVRVYDWIERIRETPDMIEPRER